jgi:hypothetical protein
MLAECREIFPGTLLVEDFMVYKWRKIPGIKKPPRRFYCFTSAASPAARCNQRLRIDTEHQHQQRGDQHHDTTGAVLPVDGASRFSC